MSHEEGFIVDKDLNGYTMYEGNLEYTEVDYFYDKPDVTDDEEFAQVMNFFYDHDIYPEEFVLDKIVKYDGQYFSVIEKSGKKYSIVTADANLEDFAIVPISYDQIPGVSLSGDGSISEVEDFTIIKGKVVVNFYARPFCPDAHSFDSHIGDRCAGNSYVKVYDIVYNIFTKTDGNGEVSYTREINDDEEEVLFQVIPNEGYVLGEIKVTDSQGKTVTFQNNKFVIVSPKNEKNP